MSEAGSGHDTVFGRRWVLPEDELLQMLWRCHGGENPDVVLVELHAARRAHRRLRARPRTTRAYPPAQGYRRSSRGPRISRHCQRRDGNRLGL